VHKCCIVDEVVSESWPSFSHEQPVPAFIQQQQKKEGVWPKAADTKKPPLARRSFNEQGLFCETN